jgi:hypothetical protein
MIRWPVQTAAALPLFFFAASQRKMSNAKMKFAITAILVASVLLASTRAAPVPLSDDLLLDDDVVDSVASDVDVDLSSDSDLSDDDTRRSQPEPGSAGAWSNTQFLHCCPNGQYGSMPNCNPCPAGTTAACQGTGSGCLNTQKSSCKACPNACYYIHDGSKTCVPVTCANGKTCVPTRNTKKGYLPGQCYMVREG